MSISLNLYYNYANYPEGNIPLSVLIKDQVYCYKMGIKNLYYCNTPDGDGETEKETNCESGACAI
jgi:ribonucleoside-diphosphate reductase alpha chain